MCRKLGWFGLAILLLAALAFPVLAEGGARLTEQGEMATQQLDLLTVPVMEGEGWKSADVAGYALYREKHADGCIYIQEMEKPEELGYTAGKDAASDFYQKVLSQLKYYFPGERTRYEVFDLGEGYTKWPVMVYCHASTLKTRGEGMVGEIRYVRGTREYRMIYSIYPESVTDGPVAVQMSLDELIEMARSLKYDESESPVGLKLTAKNDVKTLNAGQKLQMKAAFNDTTVVNEKEKNDKIIWLVTDEVGDTPDGLKISETGQLTVGKGIKGVLNITITAVSKTFGTSDSWPLIIMPPVTSLTLEPKSLTFYVGTDEPQEVKVTVTPEIIPPEGLTWKSHKESVATVEPGEGGIALVRPVGPGKTTITVMESVNMLANTTVKVIYPVTSVTLSAKGEPKPGKTVAIKCALEPEKAGNKTVEWSTDAPENVATINENGQLKIAKDAEPGTEITVTCRAVGAPEPIEATVTLTVPLVEAQVEGTEKKAE